MKIEYTEAKSLGIVDEVIEHWKGVNKNPEWQQDLIIKSWKHDDMVLYVDNEWLAKHVR